MNRIIDLKYAKLEHLAYDVYLFHVAKGNLQALSAYARNSRLREDFDLMREQAFRRLVTAGSLAVAAVTVPLPAHADEVNLEQLPPYAAQISTVTAEQLGSTWRAGCPLSPERLRMLSLRYVDMAGRADVGQLVVDAAIADEVVDIFSELYHWRFPIERMNTMDTYGADDDAAMADNNTSGFNCRPIAGTDRWSKHSYGRAIDINTRLNPYIRQGAVSPPNGEKYADRSRSEPGMLHESDPAVRAFTDRGWTWGGQWTEPIDYQHFERPEA